MVFVIFGFEMLSAKEIIVGLLGAILFLIIFSSPVSGSKLYGWQSYTSTSRVRYMDYFNDSLQVVTAGGWLKIDPSTGGMDKITNTDGIGTNNLYYILKDSAGPVWLAGYGRLIRFHDSEFVPYLFFDRNDNLMTLFTIADDGDQLWVGTSTGLALFSKYIDDGQIEDFYFRFGNLNAESAVYDILLLGDTIWIATADGLAIADRSNPDLLKSFANWTTLRPSDFVGSSLDTVTALAYYHNKVYIGTTRDVFRLEMTPTDTSLVDISTRPNIDVKHMIPNGDSLIIYAGGGFFVYDEPSVEWNYTPTIPDLAFSSGRFIDTVHWLGDYISGIYYGADTLFFEYDDGGLPGNQVSALSSDADGNIAGGLWTDGVAVFDGTFWDQLDFDQIRNGVTSILHDDQGDIWVGSWGGGVSLIKDDTTITFKEENSALHGVHDLHSYVVVNGLARTSNYIFMLNFAARDRNPVCVVDMSDITRWESFGYADGITIDLLYSIDCYDGVFVVGTQDNGVFYYYYGQDPFDKSDDSVINLRESNSWLGSDNVKTIKFNDQGDLWVGTKFGLSKYDIGIDRFINVNLPLGFGPEVAQLAFERRGNIWMAAQNGLARYDAGIGSMQIYTTLNSGLSDNYVTALLVDRRTNDLWVGTKGGMSKLKSSIGAPAAIENVVAFPNPFIIRSSSDVLSFNYDGNAIVRIYTVSGELVREMDINIPWDGKNQQQQDVAPGVYLFLLTADDGTVGKARALLIRE